MNRRTFCVFSLFITLLSSVSCSNLNFIASGKTPFKISAEKNSDQIVEVNGTADFYFWGNSPGTMKIDLEDIEAKYGFIRPSFVSVEQSIGWKSFFYTAITLGLYCPVDYKIKMLKGRSL